VRIGKLFVLGESTDVGYSIGSGDFAVELSDLDDRGLLAEVFVGACLLLVLDNGRQVNILITQQETTGTGLGRCHALLLRPIA
jgi:hypothetical protein